MEPMQQKTIQQFIYTSKQRDLQYRFNLQQQWKHQRHDFFTYQIPNKLRQTTETKNKQQQIYKLFLQQNDSYSTLQIDVNNLGHLQKYKKQIQELKQSYQAKKKQFERKEKQCLPFMQIVKLRLSSLKRIQIQFLWQEFQSQICVISAFQLFKIIHVNQSLTQCTIKGVKIQNFQPFINLLSQFAHKEQINQKLKKEHSWMMNFNLSQSLRLTIEALIKFNVCQETIHQKINRFLYFIKLFDWISDITVFIELKVQENATKWINNWYSLLVGLRKIKQIKLKIHEGSHDIHHSIDNKSISDIRFVLFGELATFTEIKQLSFNNFSFHTNISINNLLIVQQNIKAIFEKNEIRHLSLNNCYNFPVAPKITTLISIQLWNVTFLKQFDFLNNVVLDNQFLRFIKFIGIDLMLRIDENLLNRFQTLHIQRCRGIYFGDFQTQNPSNIKHLTIYQQTIENVNILNALFYKLTKIVELRLSNINFDHSLLCIIPSPHLELLQIRKNKILNNDDMQAIDQKWRNLKEIILGNCQIISADVWSICQFKRLVRLQIPYNMLEDRKQALYYLKRIGVRIYY